MVTTLGFSIWSRARHCRTTVLTTTHATSTESVQVAPGPMPYDSRFSWNEPTDRIGIIVAKRRNEVECYFGVRTYHQRDVDRKQVMRDLYRRVSRITVVC
jgi:hypothetical protein